MAARNLFDPKRTASRLSMAQRRAVVRGGISDERPSTIRILVSEWLFYREPTIGTSSYSLELTGFGQAVQAVLWARGERP